MTNDSGVHDGNEEDGNEKLGDGHGEVCGFSAGQSTPSQEICPRFYICPLICYRLRKPCVGPAACPVHWLLFARHPKQCRSFHRDWHGPSAFRDHRSSSLDSARRGNPSKIDLRTLKCMGSAKCTYESRKLQDTMIDSSDGIQ